MKTYNEFINENYSDESKITSDKLEIGDKLKLRRLPVYASKDTGYGSQKETIKTVKSIIDVKIENVDPEEYEGTNVITTILCRFKEINGLFSILFRDDDLIAVYGDKSRYEPIDDIIKLNEQNDIKISIQDIYNTIKDVFKNDDVLSTDSVYQTGDNGMMLIISINKLFSSDQVIIYTKLLFHVDNQKMYLTRNAFEYLYTLPNPNSQDITSYREINITDTEDLKNKLNDIISNNKFGDDIKILSELIKKPEHMINDWFYKNNIQDISITGFKFEPKIKTLPSKSLYFEFSITINEKDEMTLTIRKTSNTNFRLSFDMFGKTEDIDKPNLQSLIQTIGETIKNKMRK